MFASLPLHFNVALTIQFSRCKADFRDQFLLKMVARLTGRHVVERSLSWSFT